LSLRGRGAPAQDPADGRSGGVLPVRAAWRGRTPTSTSTSTSWH